jgi:hypothetical protein
MPNAPREGFCSATNGDEAYYDPGGRLVYAGRASTGINTAVARAVMAAVASGILSVASGCALELEWPPTK